MTDFTKFKAEDFLAEQSFINYLQGKNAEDVRFWKDWIAENNECLKNVEEARLLFFVLKAQDEQGSETTNHSAQQHFESLRPLLTTHDVKRPSIPQIGTRGTSMKKALLYLSGVAAIILIAFSVWTILRPSQDNAGSQYHLFAQTKNDTKQVSLPDGSTVQLNNNSTVSIADDYNTKKREVLLTGSAFFEVKEDHSNPFIVTAGLTKTTAIGTAFYIYGLNRNSTTISLVQGRVSVEERGNKMMLEAGQKASYTSGSGLTKSIFNTTQFVQWRNGKIAFEQAEWNEIKTLIEEYFNREVVVNGNVPKVNFTGQFDAEKIETLLDALNFTYNADYVINGHTVNIAFKTTHKK